MLGCKLGCKCFWGRCLIYVGSVRDGEWDGEVIVNEKEEVYSVEIL